MARFKPPGVCDMLAADRLSEQGSKVIAADSRSPDPVGWLSGLKHWS